MGEYVESLATGDNLNQKSDLSDDTICNYLRAAASWMQHHCGVAVPLYTNEGGTRKAEKLNPYISELLAQRRTWAKKKDKKEPLTGRIFRVMEHLAATSRHGPQGDLSKDCVLYDCCRLGLFTGSRLSEYGQGALPTGTPSDGWLPLPTNRDVPSEWQGKPSAFIASDFEFFDDNQQKMPHAAVLDGQRAPTFVHVRFRYDKSKFNFITRKYKRVHGHHLCPVAAALSLVQRGPHILHNSHEPLAMFRGSNHRRYTVRGRHIQAFMQRACVMAYPDAQHYLRIHIARLMSHSLRVTAAVALNNAGVSLDDIAFRLRWNSEAVKLYIRDCYRTIGDLTNRALAGACADVV
jgi:hypothetical protein